MNLRVKLLLMTALLATLLALPGCGGCWGGSSAAKKKQDGKGDDLEAEIEKRLKDKTKNKPKDDFEPLALRMLPSNDPTPSTKQAQILVKPGHWTAVTQTATANNFDFPGEIGTFVEQNATNQPLEIEDTTSRLASWCPAILPKGQSKRIESLFYVPRRIQMDLGRVYSLRSELRGLRGARTELFNTTIAPSLRDYEHLIVVLAGSSLTPAAYTHFDRLLSVKMPDIEAEQNVSLRHYYVFRPATERGVPLPSQPMAWTTIAYVFWDDLDPALLTTQQQDSLVDWLHWGGQLVISGPNSIDKLKGSFLESFLPGESTQTIKLAQDAFEELNQTFSLDRDAVRLAALDKPPKGEKLRRITILEERPMVGIDVRLHPTARAIEGTGGLVVERRVGGGRVVLTRFPLTDVRIKQWRSFDNFFNAALLRRPGRVFSQDQYNKLTVNWNDPNLSSMLLDARVGSTLRYFSRDIGTVSEPEPRTDLAAQSQSANPGAPPVPGAKGRRGAPVRTPTGAYSGAPVYGSPGFGPGGFPLNPDEVAPRIDTSGMHPGIDDWRFCGYESKQPSGVAAWNDRGAASDAARQILTEAAGIQIPSAEFVIRVLAVYLLVLVPLNWIVFWLMGRVEWAWVAAPIIAVVGAGAVIRLAQLDIGFARSRTEIAILEVQGGYERAHLTRYTALYSSLSSSYTLAFDDPSALAAPFSSGPRNESLLSITQYNDVAFRRDKDTSLAGVQVSSNSTGMVHSEQMLPLGSSPKVNESIILVGDEEKGFSIRNTTDLVLRDVGVFRRPDRPAGGRQSAQLRIETAYLAKIDPATSAPVRFSPLETKEVIDAETGKKIAGLYPPVWLKEWNSVPILAGSGAIGDEEQLNQTRIRLTRLARLASDRLRLLPGEVRLIGWTDQRLPGMRIRPEAPQNATYTLVLAHLTRATLPPVKPDQNVAEDFLDATFNETEPETETPMTNDQ